MAKRFSSKSCFDVPAPALFELYADTSFQEAKAVHMGARSASATRAERPDGKLEVTVTMVRPRHGGGDTDEHATMTMLLDPKTLGSTWRQVVRGYERRARVEGTSCVRAMGAERCELTVEGSIEIKIPLLGRLIERKIVEAIERSVDQEAGFIQRVLDGRHAR